MKKTRHFLCALFSVAVALVSSSCNNNEEVFGQVELPNVKLIPYTVHVGQNTTRATVDADLMTLRFASGDVLYISGKNISGELTMESGAGETSATFSGNLIYTGAGDPASSLALRATLKNASQVGWTNSDGVISINYGTSNFCSTVQEAVQKYSLLTGTATYGNPSFSLSQQTAFLNFTITFKDETAANTSVNINVANGSTTLGTGTVTTEAEQTNNTVVAKFVVPLAAGTTLGDAKVTVGTEPISFGGTTTLLGQSYRVNRNAGHGAVQLWPDGPEFAETNVGGDDPEDPGVYFQWGDTTPYTVADCVNNGGTKIFAWTGEVTGYTGDYLYGDVVKNGSADVSAALTKYVPSNKSFYWWDKSGQTSPDNKLQLDAEDDMATAYWGPEWRMPTKDEIAGLINNTTQSIEYVNNFPCCKFTSKTDATKFIYLPLNGYLRKGTLRYSGEGSLYYSSTVREDAPSYTWSLYVWYENNKLTVDMNDLAYGSRSSGRPVRAVRATNP